MQIKNTLTDLENVCKRLERIEALLLPQKPVLNFKEAVEFTGFSESYLYKLTSGRRIPFYCPTGKKLYFKNKELEDWLLSNSQKTIEEIGADADLKLIKGRGLAL